jgi:uncharacterized protein YodC (DUF2158 family)
MSSDWQFIEDHMGGHGSDGLPNFMSEPGFSDGGYGNPYFNYEDNNKEIEFNIGDVVKLNSSDVLMTVKNIDNDILECRWFDKNNNIQNEIFNIKEVTLANKIEDDKNSIENQDIIPSIDIGNEDIPF